jgi:hypothetical protein
LKRTAGTREWVAAFLYFSCIIPYRVREQRVEILRVFHTAKMAAGVRWHLKALMRLDCSVARGEFERRADLTEAA